MKPSIALAVIAALTVAVTSQEVANDTEYTGEVAPCYVIFRLLALKPRPPGTTTTATPPIETDSPVETDSDSTVEFAESDVFGEEDDDDDDFENDPDYVPDNNGRPHHRPHDRPHHRPHDRPHGRPHHRPHGRPQHRPHHRPDDRPHPRPKPPPIVFAHGNLTLSARTKSGQVLSAIGGHINGLINGGKMYRVLLPSNLSEVASVSLRVDVAPEVVPKVVVLSRRALRVFRPFGKRGISNRAIFVRESKCPKVELNAETVFSRPKPPPKPTTTAKPPEPTTPTPPEPTRPETEPEPTEAPTVPPTPFD